MGFDQIMIAVFGTLAIGMTQQKYKSISDKAWISGLIAQPFFLIETWQADQIGQFIVAVLVTVIWLQGGYNAYIRRRDRLALQGKFWREL